jgi:hypothetical protein
VGNTYLRRIQYSHPDPKVAVNLLSALIKTTDEMIRDQVRDQTDERISYVKNQLEEITHPQHRKALISILMEQEQVRMMVNMDEPFAASVAEPPSSTSRPHWPKQTLFYPALIFVGAFLGYAISSVIRKK